jgi:hypothetical protein
VLWSQFSAIFANFGEKWRFFLKTNVMIHFMHELGRFAAARGVNNANFLAKRLGETILKIIALVPAATGE